MAAPSVAVAHPAKMLPKDAPTKSTGGTRPLKNSFHTSLIESGIKSSGTTGPRAGFK